jgi:hypothetical protein
MWGFTDLPSSDEGHYVLFPNGTVGSYDSLDSASATRTLDLSPGDFSALSSTLNNGV